MKIVIRLLGVGLAAVLGASALSACGTSDQFYAPASYGQYYGSAWHCYYVHDPYEVTQLVHAGHCHYGDVPTLMPLWWHERYYDYYSGGGYVNHFVLPSYRTTYRQVQVTQFGNRYGNQIRTQSRLATWKNRAGKTVAGTRVKPRFTSGTTSRRYGGGNSRTGSRTGTRTSPCCRSSGGSRFGGGGSRVRGR